MDSNNVIVKTITFYNTIFKKKISRISVLLIIMIAIVFSNLFTVNNFNQNKVFELRLENSNDNNGFLVSNPKESIFFINKLHIKNEFEATEREPLISSYGLSIIEKIQIQFYIMKKILLDRIIIYHNLLRVFEVNPK